MAFEISYFFLFGLITFISGKPAKTQDYAIPSEIETLLQELSNQDGKYDIAFSHHEDGPKIHHEDTARIFHYDNNNHPHGASHEKYVDHDNNPSQTNTQSLNKLFKNKPDSRSDDNNFLLDQLLELQNDRQCENAKCKEWKWRFQRKGKYEYDNADEILEFLNELEKNFEENGNSYSESRCSGDRCSRDKSDIEESRDRADNTDIDKDRYNLRCKGNSCSRNTDDRDDNDRSDRDSLRCTGDRCGRSRDDRDDLRCVGDRCGSSRDDLRCTGDRCGTSRDDKDEMSCVGDRCGKSRDDREETNRDDLRCVGDRCGSSRDKLRCSGDRCGTSRDDRDEMSCVGEGCGRSRDDRDEMSCAGDKCGRNRDDDDRNERDNLRCSGDRCGRSRDVRDDLRCRGKSCTRSRYYEDDKSQLKAGPKLYNSNNDLDAVILDMSDLEHLLSNLNVRKNKLRGAKLLENVNLENLLSYSNANDKKSNIEAVVYDLEKRNDRDALAKQIKRLFMQGSYK